MGRRLGLEVPQRYEAVMSLLRREEAAAAVARHLCADPEAEDADRLEPQANRQLPHLRPPGERLRADQEPARQPGLRAAHRFQRLREKRPDHDVSQSFPFADYGGYSLLDARPLDLGDEQHPAYRQLQDLRQRRDALSAAGVERAQLVQSEVRHLALAVGRAVHCEIVHQDGDAVGAGLDVDLDGVGAQGDGATNAGQGVLRGVTGAGGVGDDQRTHAVIIEGRLRYGRREGLPGASVLRRARG